VPFWLLIGKCTSDIRIDNIDSPMVSVLTLSAVDRGFESGCVKWKNGELVFAAKFVDLRRKSKFCLVPNQENGSYWSDMSTLWMLFQSANTIKIELTLAFWSSTK
jgi:hypothetical protein